VLFRRRAIFEIPRFLEIWRDPKTNNIMYMKDRLRDRTSAHLLDCAWYLDCPKENAPTSKFKIQEKHETKFLQGLGALEKETPSKKKLKGGKRRGKRQIQGFGSNMQDKEHSHLIPNRNKAWFGRSIFSKSSNDFHSDNPN
jgi:hypothetical protein